MGEFLREASIGSIVLVAVGAVLAIFVSPWLHVAAQRRKDAPEAVEGAGGPPVFVQEVKPSFFSNPTTRAVVPRSPWLDSGRAWPRALALRLTLD